MTNDGQVSDSLDDESLKDPAVRAKKNPGPFRSGEMMRHLDLSIEGEMVRAIEGVDLREARRCYRDQNEFVMLNVFSLGPWSISCSARWPSWRHM